MANFFGFHPTVTNMWVWFLTSEALIILAVLIVNIIIRIILSILVKRLKLQTDDSSVKNYVLLQLCYTVGPAIRVSSWLVGLCASLDVSSKILSSSFDIVFQLDWLILAVKLVIVFVFIRMFFKLAHNVKMHFRKIRSRTDGGYNNFGTINALHRVSQVLIIIVSFFIIMGMLNISMASLAILGSTFVAAVAFTQQTLIKNIFGGVILYFEQPFSEGDWITSMDGSFEGTVDNIGLRITKFIGFDSRPFYVPNALFLEKVIINNNRMSNRRILQYIGLRYEDFSKAETIILAMKEYLKQHPRISKEKTTLVNVVNGKTNMGSSIEGMYGSYSINIMIYTFTNQTAWVEFQNIQDDVMFGLGKIIEEHGAQIAFPTQTIDFPAYEFSQALESKKS
jgi:MscS family membrane protein